MSAVKGWKVKLYLVRVQAATPARQGGPWHSVECVQELVRWSSAAPPTHRPRETLGVLGWVQLAGPLIDLHQAVILRSKTGTFFRKCTRIINEEAGWVHINPCARGPLTVLPHSPSCVPYIAFFHLSQQHLTVTHLSK